MYGVIARFPRLAKIVSNLIWGREYHRLASVTVDGPYTYIGNFNRKIDVQEKFDIIKGEFGGSTELSFEIACRIVKVRRGMDAPKNWLFIFGALLNRPEAAFSNMTLRWIISVMDTFSDMPCPLRYKLAADVVRAFPLGLRFGFSLATQAQHSDGDNKPVRFLPKREIWDGIIHFDYKIGDTYRNYLLRTERDLRGMPIMTAAFRASFKRISRHPLFEFGLTNNAKSKEVFNDVVMSK